MIETFYQPRLLVNANLPNGEWELAVINNAPEDTKTEFETINEAIEAGEAYLQFCASEYDQGSLEMHGLRKRFYIAKIDTTAIKIGKINSNY